MSAARGRSRRCSAVPSTCPRWAAPRQSPRQRSGEEDPVHQALLVGGRDVREWDLRALRRQVGVIPQEVFLFTGTVEDNLRVGAGAAAGKGDIDRALATAPREFDDVYRGVVAAGRIATQ